MDYKSRKQLIRGISVRVEEEWRILCRLEVEESLDNR